MFEIEWYIDISGLGEWSQFFTWYPLIRLSPIWTVFDFDVVIIIGIRRMLDIPHSNPISFTQSRDINSVFNFEHQYHLYIHPISTGTRYIHRVISSSCYYQQILSQTTHAITEYMPDQDTHTSVAHNSHDEICARQHVVRTIQHQWWHSLISSIFIYT